MLSTNNGNNTNDKNILVLSFCPVYCLRVVKKDTIGDNSLVTLVTFTKRLFVHVLDMTLFVFDYYQSKEINITLIPQIYGTIGCFL